MKKLLIMLGVIVIALPAYAATNENLTGLHGTQLLMERGVRKVLPFSKVCPKIVPWPRYLLFKSEGSGHLAGDPRQKGIAVIAGLRCSYLPVGPRVNIYTSKGRLLTVAVPYPGNNGIVYRWRAYNCFSGGICATGSQLLARLRALNRKDTKSYVQLRGPGRLGVVCSVLNSPVGRQGDVNT